MTLFFVASKQELATFALNLNVLERFRRMFIIESGATGKTAARSGKLKKRKLAIKWKKYIAEICANSNVLYFIQS